MKYTKILTKRSIDIRKVIATASGFTIIPTVEGDTFYGDMSQYLGQWLLPIIGHRSQFISQDARLDLDLRCADAIVTLWFDVEPEFPHVLVTCTDEISPTFKDIHFSENFLEIELDLDEFSGDLRSAEVVREFQA